MSDKETLNWVKNLLQSEDIDLTALSFTGHHHFYCCAVCSSSHIERDKEDGIFVKCGISGEEVSPFDICVSCKPNDAKQFPSE